MNRSGVMIWGQHVNRPDCGHVNCANVRRIRTEALAEGRYDVANLTERLITLICSKQPKPEVVK